MSRIAQTRLQPGPCANDSVVPGWPLPDCITKQRQVLHLRTLL